MRCALRTVHASLLILFIFMIPVGLGDVTLGGEGGGKSQNLLIIYMIAGDLESEGKAATMNIAELLDGYGDTGTEELQIVVAYGGSRTPGFEGVTYVTVKELMEDADDGIIGNADDVLYRDSDADMGRKETLEEFLAWTHNNFSAERKILVFWDHGAAYDGFGVDEASKSQLSLSDISNAFAETNSSFDMIGYDACLMGALEVAKAMQPYGRLMIGSEETEPGSGWMYETWIRALGEDPTIGYEKLGQIIIDAYMTRTNDTGKTLSLIDLTKIPALIQALDHLGNNLMPYTETIEGYRIVGKAYQVPARYGVDNRLNGETSVDLRSFLAEIRNLTPDLAGEIAHAIKLIDEAVLYHQNDEYVPQSGGLSIMSPSRMTIDIYDEIGANAKITPGWDSFFAELLAISAKDTEKPTIITSESGFVIEDPTQTAQVYAEYYYVDGEDFILLGDEPLAPDESGMYTLPEWDGLWFYLQDRTNSENYALLGMSYDSVIPSGAVLLTSEIDLVRGSLNTSAILNVYVNRESGETKLVACPYTIRPNGMVQFSRQELKLQPGDTIRSYAWQIDDDSDEGGEWIMIGELAMTNSTELIYDILPDGTYAQALYAEYGNKPGTYEGIQMFSVENGQTTLIEGDPNLTSSAKRPIFSSNP